MWRIIPARRSNRFQNCVTIMSKSSEESLCTSEDEDAQERSSETRTNEKGEAQKDERRNLLCYFTKKMYPSDFRNWPILSLLKPEFTMQIRMVMVYGIRGNRALIVTQEKDVYTLDYDHFKTGDTHIGLYPKKIEKLCGKNIKTFACNSYLILALTEEGKVYSWGFNKKRKSDDRSHTSVIWSTPTRVAVLSEKHIVDIACGSYHSLALTSDGKVYAWGENNYGQFGNENTNIVYVPRQVKHELEGKKIIHIACGSIFNMVVTDEGKLYGWGDNERGQIFVTPHTTLIRLIANSFDDDFYDGTFRKQSEANSQEHYLYPREITAVSDKVIVKVSCGFEHTLALTDEGKIYAWGRNDKGQVGVNNNLGISAPVMVNVPELVSDIAAYDNLSVAVSNNKTVYIWGDYFGKSIAIPIPTGFSTIHNAFSIMRAMCKPLTVSMNSDVDEVLNLLESLGTLFDDPSTSNFTLQVEGQPIHVHKVILKNRSQYFKNKFEHHWKNDQNVLYTIPDKFSYIIYKAFLKYLYTGTVDLPSEKVLELMKLADEYCETNLKRECGRIIEQAITTSNVAFFYNKAIECNAKEIEEFCFQFALCYMTEVVLSEEFNNLDKSIRIKFIHRAAKENAFRT